MVSYHVTTVLVHFIMGTNNVFQIALLYVYNNVQDFLSTIYFASDLGDKVCTVTEEVVSLQQNCVDCLKNVSSVLLTNEGSKMYIGAKSLLLSVDIDKCQTTSTVSFTYVFCGHVSFYQSNVIHFVARSSMS